MPRIKKAKFETKEEKQTFWHSSAHVLADAVKRLWPNVKLCIGPAVDEGFYYDFDKKEPFTQEDLKKIEEEMTKIITANLEFKQVLLSKKEAEALLKDEPYKLELLKEIPEEKVSFYQHGKFIDLCRGPHIQSTGQIGAIKLLNTASAYWRGDPKKPILQRIYGISFPTKEELEQFLKKREEAAARDHAKLGPQLELFQIFPESIGSGLPIFLPKGALLRRIIEDYWKAEHEKRGYLPLWTPHIGKKTLWIKSGHWAMYSDSMYAPIKIDEDEYLLKPMNCPFHIHAYLSKPRSYKELPIKYYELATVYRAEASGALHGLTRVRGITQDDHHIFCSPDQIKDVFTELIDFGLSILHAFGFEKKEMKVRLSLKDPKSEKYLGDAVIWDKAENALREILKERNMNYYEGIGEAAFYGPKIDVLFEDALGREWQCFTAQLDFNLPQRFDLTYTGADNAPHRPVIIHSAFFGSIERFMSLLIEKYVGAFPVWLAPVQVKILSFTDRNVNYAKSVEKCLREAGLRVEVNYEPETVEYKVREAELQKIPAIIVCGDKEEKNQTIAVRWRGTNKVQFGVKVEDFIKKMKLLESSKAISLEV
ncbi:MAG: threonine--tRNA ligase [Candidatus Nanoarchaeia archaeon]